MGVDWSKARETASDRARGRQLYANAPVGTGELSLRLY